MLVAGQLPNIDKNVSRYQWGESPSRECLLCGELVILGTSAGLRVRTVVAGTLSGSCLYTHIKIGYSWRAVHRRRDIPEPWD
jgi:hypothetical protein